jgi:hypothetical protein
MMVATIQELTVMAVLHRGAPNQECIAIRSNDSVNLGQYGLMVGIYGGESKGAWPLKDNLLWFGDGWIKKDDWLFVYTGSGRADITPGTNGAESLYSIYWGRDHTIFHAKQVVPILFRVDAVALDDPPSPTEGPQRALPQGADSVES